MLESNILVTGGAGFIGSNLVKILLESGARKIVVIDDLSSGSLEYIPKSIKVDVHRVNLSNSEKLRAVLSGEKFDFVFHLAAHFANQNSVDYPISDAQSNVIGIINLFELLRIHPPRKIVYASSSCVYGSSIEMSEDIPVIPYETPYAISKYIGELYVKYYSCHYGLPAISLRVFNTYGPFELAGHYRNVIPRFIANAIGGKDIVITGDGTEKRDFTYVTDTIECFIRAAKSYHKDGEIFNCGTGSSVEINSLANLIINKLGSKSKIKYTDKRPWDHVHTRVANMDYCYSQLGFKSSVRFDVGIELTINWYKKVYFEN